MDSSDEEYEERMEMMEETSLEDKQRKGREWGRKINAVIYARKLQSNWRHVGSKYWQNEFWNAYQMSTNEMENTEIKLAILKTQVERREDINDNTDTNTLLQLVMNEKNLNQKLNDEHKPLLSKFYIESGESL